MKTLRFIYIYIYISLFPGLNFSRFEQLPFKNRVERQRLEKQNPTELSSLLTIRIRPVPLLSISVLSKLLIGDFKTTECFVVQAY